MDFTFSALCVLLAQTFVIDLKYVLILQEIIISAWIIIYKNIYVEYISNIKKAEWKIYFKK